MRIIYPIIMGLMLLFPVIASAQSRTVHGKVTDSKDQSPLPGVTVKIKGTQVGTVSNAEGEYKLSIPQNATTLEFSFVGYATKEVTISGEEINVSLELSDRSLNEVLVVGYGTQKKRDVTGAMSKLTTKDVENYPAPSFESAIQGKAAGVVIESGSGKVGQGMKIRIRGTSSISATSQPLYVVDGQPVVSSSLSDVNNDPTNPLIDINPSDIESVEVLKDAAAAAIYGARASNGVILITTKKGRQNQKTVFSLDLRSSWGKPTMKRGFLNAKQYVDLLTEAAVNDATTDFNAGYYPTLEDAIADYVGYVENNVFDYLSLGTDWRNQEVNTNWEDQVYRDVARGNGINLSATGGNEKTNFFVSGYYDDQDAIVIKNNFKRYGARMNLTHHPSDFALFGVNLGVTRSELNRIADDNAFSTPGQMFAQSPLSPIIDPNTGELNRETLYGNALIDAKLNSDNQVTFRVLGNAFGEIKIQPWVSFRSEFGMDLNQLTQESFTAKGTIDGGNKGLGQGRYSQSIGYNTNNYFTFTPLFKNANHSLTSVLGMSYLQNNGYNTSVQAEGYPSNTLKYLSGATNVLFGNSPHSKYNFLSYFLRANYSYAGKYLLAASIRRDGSSRFAQNNKYGNFYAGSAGWVLSEENFLKDASFLNFLKLRASYGRTGNAEIGEGAYYSLYSVANYPDNPGYIPTQIGNPDLHWEKTDQFDVGLEFGFFNQRLSGEIDYYNKKTSDLLLNVNIPGTTGFTSTLQNLGNMTNKGWEITLNSINLDGEFSWTTNFNIGFNKNRVTDIKGQIIESGEQRAVEGEPIGVFYMREFAGADPETGVDTYIGDDGKPTTEYDDAPRKVLGYSNPDFTGGFTNTFSYKGFDLSAFFMFVSGNKIYNRAGVYQASGFGYGFDNQLKEVLDRWQEPGDHSYIPKVSFSYGNLYRTSSRYLYDGSYIRLKNITLGYNLPRDIANKLKLNSARLYVSGYNLWTSTKYISDPEVNTGVLGNISGGIDFYTIPQAKQIQVGLNVKF